MQSENQHDVKEGEKMELNKKTVKLICELEHLIGEECYNPKSYNGYTGEEGCEFRYPVYYHPNKEAKELEKVKWNLAKVEKQFDPYIIGTIKYMFGANHLFVGYGLVNVLEALEKRYGININELEDKLGK